MKLNIFIDTEFNDLVGVMFDPALISIGLISEDGQRCFYAELPDNYTLEMCSYFVLENVIPLLDAEPITGAVDIKNVHGQMSVDTCRELLTTWFAQFNEPVQVWSDAPSYDWRFLSAMFQGHQWPPMLLLEPKPLVIENTAQVELLYRSGNYRRHHALDDAIVMQKIWLQANQLLKTFNKEH